MAFRKYKDKISDYVKFVPQDLANGDRYSLHDGHSQVTDGTLGLEDYLNSRLAQGVNKIGLCEHNTFFYISKIKEIIANKKLNIDVLNGFELSLGGENPGHIILMDFDEQEFDKIFYEKLIRDEFQLQTFQPSRVEDLQMSVDIFRKILEHKKDSSNDKIIFPGDSLEEVLDKLLFHFQNGGLKKFPIIYIPHPSLGTDGLIKKHSDYLLKNGLTSYKGIATNENEIHYLEENIQRLKKILGKELIVLYELFNSNYNNVSDSIRIFQDHFRQLGTKPVLGNDVHNGVVGGFQLVVPHGQDFRQYLQESERLEFTMPNKSNENKGKILNIMFLLRRMIDVFCNEHLNYSKPEQVQKLLDSIQSQSSLSWKSIGWKISKGLEKLLLK